jgi:hypothetical protein
MQILERLGMKLSKNMTPARLENPEGYFEDSQIVEIHKNLINGLNAMDTAPLPDGWLNSTPSRHARQKLSLIVENRMAEAQGQVWGVKNPRTAVLLPLWTKVFNLANVVPVYILAVRDPATVAMSLKRQMNRDGGLSELQWLVRTCDAIHHTAADFFILHYEDWFRKPLEIACELLEYTGFDDAKAKDIPSIVGDIIKPNLNRAVYDDYTVQNDQVRMLYGILKECHGTEFDRERLMDAVKSCRSTIKGFKGWSDQIHELMEKRRGDKQKATRIEGNKALEELTVLNSTYLKENIALKENLSEAELREKKAQTDFLKEKTARELEQNQAAIEQRKLQRIRKSYSYRIGQIIVMAIKKPGKNTILLPFRLIRLILSKFYGAAGINNE